MSSIMPRFIRYRDAPGYLGMDKNRFNSEVRPMLVEVPIGKIGVAFDRLDLDAWADNYKERVGRQCRKKRRDSQSGANTGTLIKSSKAIDFTKALEQVTSKKQSAI